MAIDVDHLARLARLTLTQAEHDLVNADLANIIEMIDAMQSVPTDGIEPMANPLDATQRLRADTVTEHVVRDQFQANAPEATDGYYLVPKVVE